MKSSIVLSLLISLAAAQGIFKATTWNDISISGGTAGNALEEANAVFAGLPEDLSTLDASDLEFLSNVNGACNDAERGAFNTAIEAAGEGEEADAIQRGKIKNKVMKIRATEIRLLAEEAQGNGDPETLAAEQKKLANNVSKDEEEAGKESTNLKFDAEIAVG